MPLPLAPLLPIALRLGVVAVAGYAARRALARRSFPGRTDQSAEDVLDGMDEGLSLHRPADRREDGQTNAAGRMRRIIRFRGQGYEFDAGFLARVRLKRTE